MGASHANMRLAPTPSVYYAESIVRCTLAQAWEAMLDYQSWNPTFVGAQVIPVKGEPRTQGEVVLISKRLTDLKGEPLPEFFAETVRVVQHRHIVWYVYPKDREGFRNFVDFCISEAAGGVRFSIQYYEQDLVSGELLVEHRNNNTATLEQSAAAFKTYCESQFQRA